MNTVVLPASGKSAAYGEAGAGLPVVLLHAFPLDHIQWQPQLAALAAAGCRVLTPDLPGFGWSSPIRPMCIDDMGDWVVEFLSAVGVPGKAVVGGLSMGGYVALSIARRHPERVAGLILADTKAGPDDAADKAGRTAAIAAVTAEGTAGFIAALLLKVLGDATRHGNPKLMAHVRATMLLQQPAAVVAALAAMRDRLDATPGLADIRVPTLVLVGDADAVTPRPTADQLAAGISGSRLVTLPNAGHLSNIENPAAFNAAVVEFVRRLA